MLPRQIYRGSQIVADVLSDRSDQVDRGMATRLASCLDGRSTTAGEHLDHDSRGILARKRVVRQVVEKGCGDVKEPKGRSKQFFDQGFWVA